jgi:mono/diheme cytochrome c family protein
MTRVARAGLVSALLMSLLSIDLATAPVRPARAESDVPATNPLSGDEVAIREGRSWFRAACALCHGIHADGAGERGYAADLRVFKLGFRRFVETVKKGRDVPGRAAKMPPWGGALSDQQIYQIGAYLETLAKDGANWKEASR